MRPKPRLQLITLAFACATSQVSCSENSQSSDAQKPSYTPLNLLAHSVARLQRDQPGSDEIRLVNPMIFGLDEDNALFTVNFEVVSYRWPNVPQIYALVLRTSDSGDTWTQVLDPIDMRISYIRDIKFIGRRGLLLFENNAEGSSFGFLYSQSWGDNWLWSSVEGISGSAGIVGWSARSLHIVRAVVQSAGDFFVDTEETREIAYWVIETQNGFEWRTVETIEVTDVSSFDPTAFLWKDEWDTPNGDWQLVESGPFMSVHRTDEPGSTKRVLMLPASVVWLKSADGDS